MEAHPKEREICFACAVSLVLSTVPGTQPVLSKHWRVNLWHE
jgi:hypothetical protein